MTNAWKGRASLSNITWPFKQKPGKFQKQTSGRGLNLHTPNKRNERQYKT